VFAPPRTHLVVGLVGLVLFLGMAVAWIWIPLANPDGSFARPVTAAVICGCFWGGFAVLSVFLIVDYRRSRLYVSEAAVEAVGVFRTRTLVLADVTEAVWRGWPRGGSLVLRGLAGRVAINFASYADGSELAQFFRETMPPDVQRRFERFEADNIPGSEAFERRHRWERRLVPVIRVMMPFLGAALIACGVWWPEENTPHRWVNGIGGGFVLLFGLGQLVTHWRSPPSPTAPGEPPPDGGP
jgi:hypothetical protein